MYEDIRKYLAGDCGGAEPIEPTVLFAENKDVVTLENGDVVTMSTMPTTTISLAAPIGDIQVLDATQLSISFVACSDAMLLLVNTPFAGVLCRYHRGPSKSAVAVNNVADVCISSCEMEIGDVVVPPREPVYIVKMNFSPNPVSKTLDTEDDYVDVLLLNMHARSQVLYNPILTKYGLYTQGYFESPSAPPCACEWCVNTASASTLLNVYIPHVDTHVTVLDCRTVVGCLVCEFSMAHLWAEGYVGAGTKGLLGPDFGCPSGLMVPAPAMSGYCCSVMKFADHEWMQFSGRVVAPWEPAFCDVHVKDPVEAIHDFDPSIWTIIFDMKTTEKIRRAEAEAKTETETGDEGVRTPFMPLVL